MKSIQETHAPSSICFGCGPANEKGLRIRSFHDGEAVTCDFEPAAHHQAFPGMVNGGIIGSLLDCHSNWAAAVHLMKQRSLTEPPCTVTSEFSEKLKRPTPMSTLHLVARAVETDGDKVTVEATLEGGGKVCATCRGVFVAVREGHPAFHRWG
jgi:acyl-coenzyme A thioesterase PaaI-like protein